MNFHEVRFPASLSFGSVGGPEGRTDVVTLANGFEERTTPWAHSRRRYDAGLGRYTAVSMLSLRIAAVLTLVALGLYFLIALWRGRRRKRAAAGGLA